MKIWRPISNAQTELEFVPFGKHLTIRSRYSSDLSHLAAEHEARIAEYAAQIEQMEAKAGAPFFEPSDCSPEERPLTGMLISNHQKFQFESVRAAARFVVEMGLTTSNQASAASTLRTAIRRGKKPFGFDFRPGA